MTVDLKDKIKLSAISAFAAWQLVGMGVSISAVTRGYMPEKVIADVTGVSPDTAHSIQASMMIGALPPVAIAAASGAKLKFL